MKSRTFRSFAKINLGLEVTGTLPGGYHELKTIFATLSLHDLITLRPRPAGIVIRSPHAGVPCDETNLCHRAAVRMQGLAGHARGVEITIRKRIAIGGGLGGGSSNAATVLRALDTMWGLNLGPAGLIEAAKSLGADVPYFLVGGPALGLGRGDDIHPLELRLDEKVLLVPGAGGVSTAAVFREFAAMNDGRARTSRIDSFLRRCERGDVPPVGSLRNDLGPAAIAVSAPLAATARVLRAAGRKHCATLTAMSGSGSSFFLLFTDAAGCQKAASDLKASGITTHRCSFVSRQAFTSRFEVRERD